MVQNYEKFLKNLPIIPEVATKIMSLAEDKLDISFKELENIIKIDPSLTAKVLKIANSALYARQREITSLQMAITLLGFKNIKSLVLLVTASNIFLQFNKTKFYQLFWKHSIITAFMSKHIAMRINKKESADQCFVGALLHDIGQVALFNANQDKYTEIIEKAQKDTVQLEELEEQEYSINHKDLGASILGKWYFPDIFVDIAREHESANITSSHKAVIIIISVADLFSQILGYGYGTPDKDKLLDEFLPYLNLTASDIEYYKSAYIEDLYQDSLFKECNSLFQLRT